MSAAGADESGEPRLVVVPLPDTGFPDPNAAPATGLIAIGGDLSVARLIDAYGSGIFPWFDDDAEPILWWSPDPRAVLRPEGLKVSRSLRRRLARGDYRVTMDGAFASVMRGCAAPRRDGSGTWITAAMQEAYGALHRSGLAHSVEAWNGDVLVGGLYGVSLGRMFFGESMFSRATDASKVALAYLVAQLRAWNFELVDCQIMNDHLRSLGATEMSRRAFLARVAHNRAEPSRVGPWRLEVDLAR